MDVHECLKLVVSKDERRPDLCVPFSSGAYTYATNGCMCLRVDRLDEYGENKLSERIAENTKIIDVYDGLYVDVPKIENLTMEKKCKRCGGTGETSECDECDGDGEVFWTSDGGYNYEATCEKCNGTGKPNVKEANLGGCEDCCGTGKLKEDYGVNVGTKYITARLLGIVSSLPDIKIAPEATTGLHPIQIKFRYGRGIIMPIRSEEGFAQ